jgi:hypothetical protein
MKNKTECPKCLGAKELMEPKKEKGFEYKVCNLCKGEGIVPLDLADDFIFAINEDNFESNDDW